MTQINRSALLLHSAPALFALVADIERYPEFLNGCHGATVISQSDTEVVARLALSRAGISHSFVTRNAMEPHTRIGLSLVEGPFEAFRGQWQFKALGADACKVMLSLDFRMRSGLVNAAFGRLFDRVALDLVDAVVKRANTLYGAAVS